MIPHVMHSVFMFSRGNLDDKKRNEFDWLIRNGMNMIGGSKELRDGRLMMHFLWDEDVCQSDDEMRMKGIHPCV